ncbi:hypothetical protein [Paracholeplasma manati]|uniref:hypothetical protein n=1 Tax=Paracholeplasma manati TaxID=591373 RepID=UPI002408227C|nr:hypothetical protein [Paracholeplasma manati]MDG0888055.1 hypothetical protein [Paracholeplasma manati]
MKKIVSLLFLCLLSFNLTGCVFNMDEPADIVPLERSIKSTDITWLDASQGTSSVTLNFTANVKIKTITLQVTFLDKSGNIILVNTKTMTNLVPKNNYSQKFGIDFMDMLSVHQYSYKIVSGTVDLT